jgi:hypothetical protein
MLMGLGWAAMATTQLGSGAMPAAETVWSRNSMLVFPNSHFSVFAVRRAALRWLKVSCRCRRWSSVAVDRSRRISSTGSSLQAAICAGRVREVPYTICAADLPLSSLGALLMSREGVEASRRQPCALSGRP